MKTRILAVLAAAAIAWGCDGGTATKPTPAPTPTPAVASAPAPTASPAPVTPPVDNPTPTKDWDVSCHAGGLMVVYYNGKASLAEVETYHTTFDGPAHYGTTKHQVAPGKTATHVGPACSQTDAEPTVGLPAGHCYFDINAIPFLDPRSPKVAECNNRCVPRWEELEPELGEWLDGPAPKAEADTVQQTKCYQHRRKIVREQNTCTKEIRVKVDTWDEREVECPCEVNNPPRNDAGNGSLSIDWDEPSIFDWDGDGIDSAVVEVNVYNEGSYVLILEARSSSQAGWTEKDRDSASLDCGESKKLRASEGSHQWNRWRFRLLRNGSTIFTSSEQVHP